MLQVVVNNSAFNLPELSPTPSQDMLYDFEMLPGTPANYEEREPTSVFISDESPEYYLNR